MMPGGLLPAGRSQCSAGIQRWYRAARKQLRRRRAAATSKHGGAKLCELYNLKRVLFEFIELYKHQYCCGQKI